MKVLGIDTTRKSALLYLYDSEKDLKYTIQMSDKIKHSEGLFLYIEKALFECKLKIADFDVFACVVGPGSFTGIRVGMSVAKGFAVCTGAKLLPMNTFDIIANGYMKGTILLNSTNSSCYYCKFNKGELFESGVIEKSEIINCFDGEKLYILKEEQQLINLEYNNIEVIESLESLYFAYLKTAVESDVYNEFEPYYLQLSQAERNIQNDK